MLGQTKEQENLFHDKKTLYKGAQKDDDNNSSNALTVKLFRCFSSCACLSGCFYFIGRCMEYYGFVGGFLLKVSSIVLHAIDVVTDIVSGVDLASGTKIDHTQFGKENYDNYTKDICNDLIVYSHPVWGLVNIGIAWIPVVTFIPRLICHWKSSFSL